MRDYMTLGPVPVDMDCAQVGEDDYSTKSREECRRYKEMLEKMFPGLPDGVYFTVKSFPHDFGSYREVCIVYDDDKPDHVQAMLHVEHNLPPMWGEVEPIPFTVDPMWAD